MPTSHRRSHWTLKLLVSLASVAIALGIAELALRRSQRLSRRYVHLWDTSYHICKTCGECPEIFRNAGKVNSTGLRDREYAVPKPAGTMRILALGDSVTYGSQVAAEESYPKLLERLFGSRVEVINAGVPGYSPYNERKLFESVGAAYQPDLVLVQFCLNDVADPLIHWKVLADEVRIPEEAIPNPRYHQEHVLTLVAGYRKYRDYERWRNASPLFHLELFKLAERSPLSRLWIPGVVQDASLRRMRKVDGRRWPIHVTMEDSMTIDRLMDYDSMEWRWLRSQYDQLRASVEAHHARLALVIAPLSYQLAPGYPYLPQRLVERYCRERSLPCLDLLPALRAHRAEQPFFTPEDFDFEHTVPGFQEYFRDIWHFTASGNRIAAAALKEFIEGERLLP
jgi:hypothetical protein